MPVRRTHSERYVAARCIDSAEDLSRTLRRLGEKAPDLFADPDAHAALATTFRLLRAGMPVSRSTVRAEMKAGGVFPGEAWYGELLGEAFDDADLDYHLGAIEQAHAVRCAYTIASEATYTFQNGTALPDKVDAISTAAAGLLKAGRIGGASRGAAEMADLLEAQFAEDSAPTTVRMPSMFQALNKAFRGYVLGRIAIIAAETNHGKSTFADWEAINTARRCRAAGRGQVLIYDIENTPEQKNHRLLSMISGVSLDALEDHQEGVRRLAAGHAAAVRRGLDELRSLPLSVGSASTSADIYADAYAASLSGDVALITVDYAQVMQEPGASIREQVIHGVQTLHDLAHRLGCAVLLCSQVTLPKDYSGAPRIKDLAESSALKNFAATVLALHHPATEWAQKGYETSEASPAEDLYTVHIRKHKGRGGRHPVTLHYEPARLLLRDAGLYATPF